MYSKSNFASSSGVVRFELPKINNVSNELYCISKEIKNLANIIKEKNLNFQKSTLSQINLANFKEQVIGFSDDLIRLRTKCIYIYNNIKEALSQANLNTSFINVIYNMFEKKYGISNGFKKLQDINSISILSLDEINKFQNNLLAFSNTIKSDGFIVLGSRSVNTKIIDNKLNEIYLSLYKASSGITSFAKKIYYQSTTSLDTEPVNCDTFKLMQFSNALTTTQRDSIITLKTNLGDIVRQLNAHIEDTRLFLSKIKIKSGNLTDVDLLIKNINSLSKDASTIASKIQRITTQTSINNNTEAQRSEKNPVIVSSIAYVINDIGKQLETKSLKLNGIIPPVDLPKTKLEKCTEGLPLFGYAVIMPFNGYGTLYRAFNISGTWDHVPYGSNYYSNFKNIFQLNDGTFVATTLDNKYLMSNTTLFTGNWAILNDQGGITDIIEIQANKYNGFNFLIKQNNSIRFCNKLNDFSDSYIFKDLKEFQNLYHIIQLQDGRLACLGHLKMLGADGIYTKIGVEGRWEQMNSPNYNLKAMIQLQDGTIAVMSVQNKIFKAPTIDGNWVEVPNPSGITDFYQINNGTFIGVGPNGNGLFITKDLNNSAWVQAALVEGVVKYIEYKIKPSTRDIQTTVLQNVNTFEVPLNESITPIEDAINAAVFASTYLGNVINPDLTLPKTSSGTR